MCPVLCFKLLISKHFFNKESEDSSEQVKLKNARYSSDTPVNNILCARRNSTASYFKASKTSTVFPSAGWMNAINNQGGDFRI